jgi:hypothetical protein
VAPGKHAERNRNSPDQSSWLWAFPHDIPFAIDLFAVALMNVTFSARYTNISRSEGRTGLLRSRYGRGLPGPDARGVVRTPAKKGGVRHVEHVVLLPTDAPRELKDADTLWIACAGLERQWNAREARAVDFSIPRAVPERLWLPFAKELARLFVEIGLPVQVDVEVGRASDGGLHPHVHLLIATRTAGKDGLSKTKSRDLDRMFFRDKGRVLRRELAEAGNRFFYAHFVPLNLVPLSNAQQKIHPACPRYRGSWEKEQLLPSQQEWRRMRSEFQMVTGEIARHEIELKELSEPFPPMEVDDTWSDIDRAFVAELGRGSATSVAAGKAQTYPRDIWEQKSETLAAMARSQGESSDFDFDPMPSPRPLGSAVQQPDMRSAALLSRLQEWRRRDPQFSDLVEDIRGRSAGHIRHHPLTAAAAALIETPHDPERPVVDDPADPHAVAQMYMIKYELMGELAARIGAELGRRRDRSRVTFTPAEQ